MDAARLDPRTILAALGVSDTLTVSPVTGGWDTALWRIERPDGACALRVFRPDRAAAYRREALAMRTAEASGIPVPAIQAEGFWQDRPALLLSWCPGRPLLDALRAQPWRAWRLGVALGRMQARIHTVTAPELLRADADAWIAWAGPGETALQERLRALDRRSDALLHLDYHPLNVTVQSQRISGVLDWANARAGDPRADVARTLTLLTLGPLPPDMPPLLRLAAGALRRLLAGGWRQSYEQRAGPLGDLSLFYAWAGAAMVHDLTPKLGQPRNWLTRQDLAQMARWADRWKRRAGV